jgi:glycosyltransferase involved in cell wall biosynthesis
MNFVLPGLHRVSRGAEVVFESVAREIAAQGHDVVTLVGSGAPDPSRPYAFRRVRSVGRERFAKAPSVPFFRHQFMYEELTFATALMLSRPRRGAEVTVTCSYPYVNFALRSRLPFQRRAPHVFVTQNGDWPALGKGPEPKLFGCDGLICTNPTYYERNKDRWRSVLIPNGMDPSRFHPGPGTRAAFGLPESAPVVLMVSALQPSKRVLEGIEAVAQIPDAFLLVAGDGPMAAEVDSVAARLMPGRFKRGTYAYAQMPDLYRSADVFLHPTFHESFGNVYVESMACGLPLVAHDYDLTRWVTQGHGTLVDAADIGAMADAVRRALAEGTQGSAARAAFAARTYDWASIARRYRQFITEVG